jgi:hypothetical protein
VVSTESWVRDELGLLSWGFLKANGEVCDDDGPLIGYVQRFSSSNEWSGALSVHD